MVNIILNIAGIFIALGIILAAFRLIKGPTVPDRVTAFDTMTMITISLITLITYLSGRVIFLDIAMVYAMLGFIGVIAIARYFEGGL